MTWIDYIIIAIISFSCLVSIIRGFISEVLSLVTWSCAFFTSSRYYTYLSVWFTSFKDEFIRNGISITVLFIVTLTVGTIINSAISKLIKKIGLSGIDRVIGIFFGTLRGILIVATILFFFDTFTEFSKSEDWRRSQLIPHFSCIIKLIFNYLQSLSNLLFKI